MSCFKKTSRIIISLTSFIIIISVNISRAAFPVYLPESRMANEHFIAYTNPPNHKIASIYKNISDRRYKFHSNSNNKSGTMGALSFTASLLSLFCIITAAAIFIHALPAHVVSIAMITFPPAMYFFLGLSVVFSATALILGFLGIKRKHAGFAIAGFILGAILLLATATILSNI